MTTKNNRVSMAMPGNRKQPIKTESPTVEEVVGDLELKGEPPPDLFEGDLPTAPPPEAAPMIAKPPSGSDEITLIVPPFKPWKGSGRVVVQPFRVRNVTAGGIHVTAVADKNRIPPDTDLYVVSKDPSITGIKYGAKVKFAEDFVPTSQMIGNTFYYIPHYQDILLVNMEEKDYKEISRALNEADIENKKKK